MKPQIKHVRFIFGGTFDPPHLGHILPLCEAAKKLSIPHIELMPNKIPAYKAQPIASAQQRLDMLALIAKEYPVFKVQPFELNLNTSTSFTVETLQALRMHHPDQHIVFMMGSDSWLSFKKWHQYQTILRLCHIVVISRPIEQKAHIPPLMPSRDSLTSTSKHAQNRTYDSDKHKKQINLAKSLGLRCYMSSSSGQDQVSLCHVAWSDKTHGSITFVETEEIDISSTNIRESFQGGKKIASENRRNINQNTDTSTQNTIEIYERSKEQLFNRLSTQLTKAVAQYIREHTLYENSAQSSLSDS